MPEMTAVETFLLFDVQGQSKDTFKVISASGSEGISSLFRYEFELASPDHDLDYQSVLGKRGHLTIKGADADRHVHGLVSRVEQVSRSDELSRYRLSLVPAIWTLGLRQTSRIFQEKSVPDIIKKVLKDAGIPDDEVKLSVHGDHKPWEYCVQYRESDLAFISRLMEQEGIFYFFVHDDKKTVLRIGDDTSDHPSAPDVGTLQLRPTAGMTASEETVAAFTLAEEVRPDQTAVRDYNFKKPTVDLTGTAKDKPGLGTEVFDYPGEYDEPAEGKSLAKIRLEELRATRKRGSGESNCARLTPGHTFQLDGHARNDHNSKYLLLDVQHHATQPQVLGKEGFGGAASYSCSFTCIPADVPFRPPRTTPRPMAQGSQTALVVGPSGEEIHTDEHGRIKVQFHWDREGKKDENASCWVRVAQPWAGAAWGGLFLPRIGQEVIISFLDGDPDQPLVTGAVYNADNQPPYPLPGDKTKSTIKTNSSKGGGGSNEIRFEDAKGSEEIYLHGQKDWNVVIENDESDTIGANRTVSVGKDEKVSVGGSRTESVGKDETITISGGRTESVSKDETITIDGGRTENVAKDESVQIGGKRTLNIDKDDAVTVGGSGSVAISKDFNVSADGNISERSGKAYAIDVGKSFTLSASDEIALKTGSAKITLSSDGSIAIEGGDLTIKGSGNVTIKGSKVTAN